jgi:uncharacterized protein (TIRG00374 family)
VTARLKSSAVLALKLAVAAGLIWWLARSETMRSLKLDQLTPALGRWHLLLAAFGLLATVPLIGATRWLLLMRCQGFAVGFPRALHLTLVGVFFNCVGVGHTGGDVIKAYYAARDQARGRRAEAVYSVGFDRAVGLFSLVLLGAVAMLAKFRDVWPDRQLRAAALVMVGAVAVAVAGFLLGCSRRLRQNRALGQKIERFPGGQLFLRFYRAVRVYRTQYRVLAVTVGLSVLAHLVTISSIGLLAVALDVRPIPVSKFAFYVATGLAISSIGPPLGLGFGQAAYAKLFEREWGEYGFQFGFLLACLQQAVVAAFNVAAGLPAFLLVRRDFAAVQAQMRADEGAPDPAPAEESPEGPARGGAAPPSPPPPPRAPGCPEDPA